MLKKKKDPFEIYKGYYAFPFSWEPFGGQVIKLDGENLNALFQNFSDGDEYKFREKLWKMDSWLSDKPYKLYMNDKWVFLIVNWLEKDNGKKRAQTETH